MRFLQPLALSLAAWLVAPFGFAREPLPVIDSVQGWIFDQSTGALEKDDIFEYGFVPRNQMGAGILTVVTLNIGSECVVKKLSDEQRSAILRDELSVPQRPGHCDAPGGTLKVTVQHKGYAPKKELRVLALKQFSAGEDGKIRVPVFLYRNDKCATLSLKVTLIGSSPSVSKLAQFSCGE